MNLNKKIPLWRKLRIKYEYHWMDFRSPFRKPVAAPTWLMTHNAKQIDRRVAEYNAEMEAFRREQKEAMQLLRELHEKAVKEAAERSNSDRF